MEPPDVGCYVGSGNAESSREVLKIVKERELAFGLSWDKDSRGIFGKMAAGARFEKTGRNWRNLKGFENDFGPVRGFDLALQGGGMRFAVGL